MAEHAQLGDVPPEEERRRPVGDDAELPCQQRELVQVVRPRHEPTSEATEAEIDHVRDPLVTAERRHLSQHPVAIRLRLAGEVPGQTPSLSERVLARGRIEPAGRRFVGYAGAVAERPYIGYPFDPEHGVD